MRRRRTLGRVGLMAISGPGVSAGAYTHVVQSGDTLSGLANEHHLGPVWGANGSLQKILNENPLIRNPNRILVGQVIEIPAESSGDFKLAKPHGPAALQTTADEANFSQEAMSISSAPSSPSTVFEFSRIILSTGVSQSRLNVTDRDAGGKSI